MRRLILITVAFLLMGCSSTKVYVLGIDADQTIADIKSGDGEKMIFGAIASVATHIAGHYIAAELVGGEIDQQGFVEVIMNGDELSNSDNRWISRGGFVAQTLVNTILTSFEATRESYFTRGFTIATMLEIGTYPLRNRDNSRHLDVDCYNDIRCTNYYGGNGDLEWGLYTGMSLYNFYKINQDKFSRREE